MHQSTGCIFVIFTCPLKSNLVNYFHVISKDTRSRQQQFFLGKSCPSDVLLITGVNLQISKKVYYYHAFKGKCCF